MSLVNPLTDLAGWQLGVAGLRIPGGFRYAGYPARVLTADHAAGAVAVVAPCPAAVRVRSVPAGADPAAEVAELQPLGTRVPRVARATRGGLPTFYYLFPGGTAITPTDHQLVDAAETIATTAAVRIAVIFADRIPREPVLWAGVLLDAIVAPADPSMWEPFATAIATLTGGATAPVLLLDHSGATLETGTLEVDLAGVTYQVSLDPADGGDLQAAIGRLNAADPVAMPIANLWGAGDAEATVRPTGAGSSGGAAGDVQLARLEDGIAGAQQLLITPTARHVLVTDLHDWFAPQTALLGEPPAARLARYTRGNLALPLVNGPALFADLFARLDEAAQTAAGGLHLTGWSMYPDVLLTDRPSGVPETFPRKLEDAAAAIGAAGGRCCYLPAGFIQVDDPTLLEMLEVLAVFTLVAVNLVGELVKTPPERRDGTGLLLGVALLIANAIALTYLLQRDLQDVEPSHGAVDTLNAIAGNAAALSYHPLTVDDNARADIGGILFGAGTPLFRAIRHFNVFHQKIAIVRRDAGLVAYCGGIDLNPDRLDDHRHLAVKPYHDAQVRLDGPAVRDLVTTFDERWTRDGSGPPAFTPADADGLAAPGSHVVQVARTYGRAVDPARALPFAPDGDRTVLDTYLRAIAHAREFIYLEDQYLTPPDELVDALLARLTGPDPIRRLFLLVPDVTDQPFGESRRTEVIDALRAAGPGVVRIGSPRRRPTVPPGELRASSGRLILKEFISSSLTGETAVALGPIARLPDVPFWISVDGELMWIYDESTLPNPDPLNMRIFRAERGDGTRIVSGIGGGRGATPRDHDAGAAATIVNLDGIYVHAKLMIVDDVFLCIGSANLNRRGFYSDGECNAFIVPERLRSGPDNPVRAVRRQLWAEMLNLPQAVADPLLEDPLAASALFDRSCFFGNRYVEGEALPTHVLVKNFAGGNGLVGLILSQIAGAVLLPTSYDALFATIVDPSSALEA